MKVGIIGAGPAGMAAAIEAARQGAEVLLVDANPVSGRKLAATGSGRCNLSNHHAAADRYHTTHPAQLSNILKQFSNEELLSWFNSLGILTTMTEDGWIYPRSFSAQNVVDILQAHLIALGVELHPQTLITDIQIQNGKFVLITLEKGKQFTADWLILATGGPAAPQMGARDNIYPVLRKLGHSVLPVQPALAPLLTDARPFHKLQGVRVDACIYLLMNEKVIGQTAGNIIFTSWGINGPGVMDLSGLVSSQNPSNLQLRFDFLPGQEEKFNRAIADFCSLPISAVLKSFFPAKLAYFFLEQCQIDPQKGGSDLKNAEIASIKKAIHQQVISVKGIKGFKECQLSTGGVPLSEIDAANMRSMIVPGMALAGEVLDVAGPCGGYNLHWAFTSGIVAGRHVFNQ
jgi:hypothetical protein